MKTFYVLSWENGGLQKSSVLTQLPEDVQGWVSVNEFASKKEAEEFACE